MTAPRLLLASLACAHFVSGGCSADDRSAASHDEASCARAAGVNCAAEPVQAAASLAPEPRRLCAEARGSLLPAVARVEKNVGRMERLAYRRTDIPRPDGGVAIVYTDISGTASFPAGNLPVEGELAFHENEECRLHTYAAGLLGCYRKGSPPEALAIQDRHSRAFLSVAAYLTVGRRADRAAAEGSRQGGAEVWMDALGAALPGVGHIGPWYFCQSCGNRSAAGIEGGSIKGGLRFGRSGSATFFLTPDGVVAKLPDGDTQAAYARCGNEQG